MQKKKKKNWITTCCTVIVQTVWIFYYGLQILRTWYLVCTRLCFEWLQRIIKGVEALFLFIAGINLQLLLFVDFEIKTDTSTLGEIWWDKNRPPKHGVFPDLRQHLNCVTFSLKHCRWQEKLGLSSRNCWLRKHSRNQRQIVHNGCQICYTFPM